MNFQNIANTAEMPLRPSPIPTTKRRIFVVSVLSLMVMFSTVGPLTSTAVRAQSPAAVIIPNLDPVAAVANVALDQLQTDALAIDRGTLQSSSYIRLRSQLAQLVGDRLGISARELDEAWADADVEHQTAVIAALTQVGVPYKRFAMKPGVGFDCSGLTTFAWSLAGFNLPHNSTRQIRAADPRTIETAQAGDLLRYPGHVMMWLGVDQAVIHAPQPRKFVEVKILNDRSMKRSTFGDPTE